MIRGPAVYNIPAGAPFLPILADALIGGTLAPLDLGDPAALADVTVLLPTRRAVRAFGEVTLDRIGRDAAILPRVVPIGDVDEDDLWLDTAGAGDLEVLPEAVSDLERRLALARLTLSWAASVNRAAFPMASDGDLAIPASAGDAVRLAGDLARLIDDMETAGVDWTEIDRLAPDDDAGYFRITLDFLRIVREHWPGHLDEIGRADPAARRDRLIRAEAARVRAGRYPGPVVAAGSTGSVPATADLLAAIANAPNGAVVLPGLDTDLDERSWAAVDEAEPGGGAAAHGHPQFGLKRLLGDLGVDRADVVSLQEAPAPARVRLLSGALRPAPTTDAWAGEVGRVTDEALAGFSLVVARNEQEEAVAAALALRELVETPGRTGALVTPDRGLARRVTAELARWGLSIDDSAGGTLATEPAGVFAALVAAAAGPDAGASDLLAVIKHPLANFGLSPSDRQAGAVTIDLAVLRGVRFPGIAALPELVRDRRAAAADDERRRDLPRSARGLADWKWEHAQGLADKVAAAFAPLIALAHEQSIAASTATRALVETLQAAASGDETARLWSAGGGVALADLLTELMNGRAAADLNIPADGIAALLAALMEGVRVPREPGGDTRLHIWGTLEARLQSVDVLVVGGLDEGVWPTAVGTDPWLSRTMRTEIGLPPPERRLGLAAHDFALAASAPNVVVTRAAKRGGAPTVESRWLQRMRAVAGKAFRPALDRGERLLRLARLVDRYPAEPPRAARRPDPKPPLAARPERLSVTEVETLIRDPYAIYARRVLRLEPLDRLGPRHDAALRGSLFHDALGKFTEEWAGRSFDERAVDRLNALAAELLETVADAPELQAIWAERFAAIAGWFVGWEADRDQGVAERHAEIDGKQAFGPSGKPLTLNGRADRIDLMSDGSIAIYDFKTGTPPSPDQMFAQLAPQMALEAAMVRAGGFGDGFTGRSVSALDYLAIGKAGRGDVVARGWSKARTSKATGKSKGDLDPDAAAARASAFMDGLAARYADPAAGYLSRARPMTERRFVGDYDHLARVQEWSLLENEDDYD